MSKKKPAFPVNDQLLAYLKQYKRYIEVPVLYEDLLRFSGSITVYNDKDEDTLWIRVYYSEYEREEIDQHLKKVYSILHSDGSDYIIPYLNVDAIDFCTFGNSKPFRVKIRNIINDNFTYFYVKQTDASRIYGLELEHMLSPYNLNFLVHKDTLIEEHILGIPGDVFIESYLNDCTASEKAQIAKEFVKFNERCMIRLLGDMRSYNYVIVPIHDFDHVEYKIRAIDFDQQSFEGRLNIYRPQFFKENNQIVEMVRDRLNDDSITQYKLEERSILAKRIISWQKRLNKLIDASLHDKISLRENVDKLKMEIYDLTHDVKYKSCESMGEILDLTLSFVKRNYENVTMSEIITHKIK